MVVVAAPREKTGEQGMAGLVVPDPSLVATTTRRWCVAHRPDGGRERERERP